MGKEFNFNEVEAGVVDYIQELLNSVPKEYRASMVESIIVQSVNFGTYNVYEAVGVIECAKLNYLSVVEEVMLGEGED